MFFSLRKTARSRSSKQISLTGWPASPSLCYLWILLLVYLGWMCRCQCKVERSPCTCDIVLSCDVRRWFDLVFLVSGCRVSCLCVLLAALVCHCWKASVAFWHHTLRTRKKAKKWSPQLPQEYSTMVRLLPRDVIPRWPLFRRFSLYPRADQLTVDTNVKLFEWVKTVDKAKK